MMSWFMQLWKRIIGAFHRKEQFNQKNNCAALSFYRTSPGADPCAVCGNQYCICYPHSQSAKKVDADDHTAEKPSDIVDEADFSDIDNDFEPIDIDLPEV